MNFNKNESQIERGLYQKEIEFWQTHVPKPYFPNIKYENSVCEAKSIKDVSILGL